MRNPMRFRLGKGAMFGAALLAVQAGAPTVAAQEPPSAMDPTRAAAVQRLL